MITSIDHTLFHFINQSIANPLLDAVCPILRNRFTWLPFYIIGGSWVLYKYRLNGLWILLTIAITILLSDQFSNLIKMIVHRARPCHTEGVRILVACSDTYSFTSNHAANHFALATFLTLLFCHKRWVAYVLFLWASLVCFSQIYVGIHYPADIAAGALLGAGIGAIVYNVFERIVDVDI
jgi:undecaprenyl-diphosphatase